MFHVIMCYLHILNKKIAVLLNNARGLATVLSHLLSRRLSFTFDFFDT